MCSSTLKEITKTIHINAVFDHTSRPRCYSQKESVGGLHAFQIGKLIEMRIGTDKFDKERERGLGRARAPFYMSSLLESKSVELGVIYLIECD